MFLPVDQTQAADLEKAILQIPDIRAVRVVVGPDGNPVEVHVVAGGSKVPKQIVRDVQTVAMATVGTQIDHRIVSVVQFPEEEGPAPATAPSETRVTFDEISTETRGTTSRVRVALSKGGQKAAGEAAGVTSSETLTRLAAAATIEAIKKLRSNGHWLALEDASISRLGTHDVAIATVVMGPGPITLSGSAVVTGQHTEAIVRAVLDAVNRRLSL
ncbi:MAG: hypothetical protein ACRDI1_00675 [Actinomycetota bacterium]